MADFHAVATFCTKKAKLLFCGMYYMNVLLKANVFLLYLLYCMPGSFINSSLHSVPQSDEIISVCLLLERHRQQMIANVEFALVTTSWVDIPHLSVEYSFDANGRCQVARAVRHGEGGKSCIRSI